LIVYIRIFKKIYVSVIIFLLIDFLLRIILGEVQCQCGNSLGGCQKFIDRPELGALCALKCKQIKFMIENKLPYIEFATWNKNDRFDIEELEET
jgi:hypothetical protein